MATLPPADLGRPAWIQIEHDEPQSDLFALGPLSIANRGPGATFRPGGVTVRTPDPLVEKLLAHLGRAGAYGYIWELPARQTIWYQVGSPPLLPDGGVDVYFGVHPTNEIPSANKKGEAVPPEHVRACLEHVAAINCLFAEFDAKDFGDDMDATLAHVKQLDPQPTACVNSGGGFHCYWLFKEPFVIVDENGRERAKQLQADWVKFVGGDGGAKDLARVLRVPGTWNHKYSPPHSVTLKWFDENGLFTIEELELTLPTAGQDGESLRASGPGAARNIQARQAAALLSQVADWRADDYNAWIEVGMALSELGADGLLLWNEWSKKSSKYELWKCQEKWRTFKPGDGLTLASLWLWAKTDSSNSGRDTSPSRSSQTRGPLRTDVGNGQRLAGRHGTGLRYVTQWGWLVWDGRCWRRDDTGAVMRYAKDTATSIFEEALPYQQETKSTSDRLRKAVALDDKPAIDLAKEQQQRAEEAAQELRKWAIRSQARARLEAMISLATSEPAVVARPDDFDVDPFLLNCRSGTLDLRSNNLKPHDRADLITRLCEAAYDHQATCSQWQSFLNRIFAGNENLIRFVQRAVGYSLTGDVREQCLFFLYGIGSNGKTTFCELLLRLFCDYAKKTPAETLLVKKYGGGIPNDVAALHGARVVVAAELGQGRTLNEALVKDLTGGDTISARYLHKEFFAFRPQFKLWMYGNHKPRIMGTDDGIWRRIMLIPFTVTIPAHDRDMGILKKLEAESSGILAWAVQGCLDWQQNGLNPPPEVVAATADYREEQDLLGQFLAECCVQAPNAWTSSHDLCAAYVAWAGEDISQKDWGARLGKRGFTAVKSGGVRGWQGVGLLATGENQYGG